MTDRGSSKDRQKPVLKPVPMTVIDVKSQKQFTRGKFLGKGGFARCYELIDQITKTTYAGKVVSKTLLQKKHQKDKVSLNMFDTQNSDGQELFASTKIGKWLKYRIMRLPACCRYFKLAVT